MAIQVRRGNEADFDASKMLPGEWAVSLDTQYVRMCFAPGIVLRMATYEGFENDKAQIQAILAECQNIQSAVERIQSEVNAKASLTVEYSNSAKESADRAYSEAERAKTYADNAEAVTGVNIATQDKAGLVKGGDIYIDEDGALVFIKETTESSMPNSHAGRLKINEIGGVMEQGANPSPTNPQEIRKSVVSGIKTIWKNLANLQNDSNIDKGSYTYTTLTAEKVVATKKASGGCFVARYVANLKAGTTYHVSLTENSYQVYFYYDELWGSVWKTFSSNDITITPLKDGTYVIGVYVTSAVTSGSEVTVSNFMIEEGTEATPYEPYTESAITFSQPIELYGKDDVRDILTSKQIKRKWQRETLMIADSITQIDGGYRIVCSLNEKASGILKVISTHFVPNTNYSVIGGMVIAGSLDRIYMQIPDSLGITTLEDVNSWLLNNGVTLVYELAEETTEELPLADQIALNSLQTFDGITYVEFISEIKPTFSAKYGTAEMGGMTLESLLTARNNDLRLSTLEASLVNNI